jgi:ankyrin repeat protein
VVIGRGINRPDKLGRTAVHAAASHGQAEAMGLLVRRFQADVTAQDLQGRTAVFYANSPAVLDQLLLLGLDYQQAVTKRDLYGQTPLHSAVARRDQEMIRRWLSDGLLRVNQPDERTGTTPLQLAAFGGWVEGSRLLLSLRAEPALLDWHGQSVLHYASVANKPETLRFFLSLLSFSSSSSSSAAVSDSEPAEDSSSSSASASSEEGGAKSGWLDPNLRDEKGRTALFLACHAGSRACVDLLLPHLRRNDPSLLLPAQDGRTPLLVSRSAKIPN